jgi:hypothetical protein
MADDSRQARASGAWNSIVILSLIRRQIDDSERARRLLLQSELPPDDNPALLHVLSEMRSLRQMASEIEFDLNGE